MSFTYLLPSGSVPSELAVPPHALARGIVRTHMNCGSESLPLLGVGSSRGVLGLLGRTAGGFREVR